MSKALTLAKFEVQAAELDETANTYSLALAKGNTPFTSALLLADGIAALRELLDDNIMSRIMHLAGSPLGFLTDRDHLTKEQQEKGLRPYKPAEIRDAIIEASLRGFRVVGNEFNVIASRFYAAKAGLHRKVITYPGVTNFEESFCVPKMSGDRGALVTATAKWRKDGTVQELTREFAIRVNNFMGADAITGKAQRKLYAAVLNQLSGIVTPEGDLDDSIPGVLPMKRAEVKKHYDEKRVEQGSRTVPMEHVAGSPVETEAIKSSPTVPEKEESKTVFVGEAEKIPIEPVVDARLFKLMEKSKVTASEVIGALMSHTIDCGFAAESGELIDLPPQTVEMCVKQWPTVIFTIERHRKGK